MEILLKEVTALLQGFRLSPENQTIYLTSMPLTNGHLKINVSEKRLLFLTNPYFSLPHLNK